MKHDVRLRPLLPSNDPQLYARVLQDVAQDVVLRALTGTDPQSYPRIIQFASAEASPPPPPEPAPITQEGRKPSPEAEAATATTAAVATKAPLLVQDPYGLLSGNPALWPEELKQAIARCCCGDEGSSSSSAPIIPNGCAGCACCPCVCWWQTDFHRLLTPSNILEGPAPGPVTWTLTSNTLTLIGTWPEWMYLGDIASVGGSCDIGGLVAIDDNGDVILDPLDPRYPYFEGDLTYSGPFTLVLHVVIRPLLRLQFNCTGDVSDGVIWSGTSVTEGGFPYTPPPGMTFDYYPVPNDIVGGIGTLVNCGGTIPIAHDLINLPPLTVTPLYDPNCVP